MYLVFISRNIHSFMVYLPDHHTRILKMKASASISWPINTFVELPARRMGGSAHSRPPYEDGSSTNVLSGREIHADAFL